MGKLNFSGIMNITKGFIMKHSPEILIGAGIVGMFTTTVIAVKNTPKAIKRIEEAEEEKVRSSLSSKSLRQSRLSTLLRQLLQR